MFMKYMQSIGVQPSSLLNAPVLLSFHMLFIIQFQNYYKQQRH